MSDRTGQRFDDYHLTRLLGHGTFGEVYAAEQVYDQKQVAIKILKQKLTTETITEFLREARLIRLKHPHITPLLDFGVSEQEFVPFLVMVYVPNGTLRQRHVYGTCIPVSQASNYVQQIASALQYAHDHRLIHRDVKPENILLDEHDSLQLSDFGIVTIAHSEYSMHSQGASGTLPYMAPEQIDGKPRPASDQYALGIMAYEWLCGVRPFQGSIIELITQHCKVPPAPLRHHNSSLSASVEIVVLKALAKDPQERFSNVQEFALAFEQAVQNVATPTAAITTHDRLECTLSEWTIQTPDTPAASSSIPDLWLERGNAFYASNSFGGALAAYNRAIQLDPNSAMAYCGCGRALIRLRRFQEALDACNYAIHLDHHLALAHAGRGGALAGLKRYQEGLEACNYAISLENNLAFAYIGKASSLCGLKRYQEALASIEQAIQFDSLAPSAYNIKGVILQMLKRYQEAFAMYEQALALDPTLAQTYHNRGMLYLALRRYPEALEAFEQALRIEPALAEAFYGKSLVLRALQRPVEALAVCNQAVQLDPSLAPAYVTQGSILMDLQRYQEALTACEQATRLDPQLAGVYTTKSIIFLCMRSFSDALSASEQAIHLEPSHAPAYNNKSIALLNLQRYQEALVACERAIYLDPTLPIYYNNKSICLFRLRHYPEALYASEQALSINPQLAEAHYHRGKALDALQRYWEAQTEYNRARELGYRG